MRFADGAIEPPRHRNPLAAMQAPLTMDDYLQARMIREPLCMLDMDVPVDGADAFVLTTTERARKLTPNPVVIHAASVGLVGTNDEVEEDMLAMNPEREPTSRLSCQMTARESWDGLTVRVPEFQI